ncbi:unnamed protein product [Prorocentrum cordatum]|uniref:Uncharacterized protein n=1 Tax=Prorocentrum cordatum TaxID=2364126 RepID=A0ABN9S5I8_9DINO|nr:unnamed protein product [Polarella glacialis]
MMACPGQAGRTVQVLRPPPTPIPPSSSKEACGRERMECALAVAFTAAVHRGSRRRVCPATGLMAKKPKIQNEWYKGAKSYGTVGDDEFEEAERIRNGFQQTVSSAFVSATNLAAARRRLQKRRLLKGRGWEDTATSSGASASLDSEDNEGETDGESDSDGAEDCEGTSGGDSSTGAGNARERNKIAGVSGVASSAGSRAGDAPSSDALFVGSASTAVASSPNWPGASVRRVGAGPGGGPLRRGAPGRGDSAAARGAGARLLSGAASALSAAGRHPQADGAPQRRSWEAGVLFEAAGLRLGLELRRAGELARAWEALLGLCSEPALREPKKAVEALADVSLALSRRLLGSPRRQVEVLQGAADAQTTLKALPVDRRDELSLNLALAMQSAGMADESRALLKAVREGGGSEARRQQAAWALEVADADIGDGPIESAVQMRALWDEAGAPGSAEGLGGLGAAGAGARAASRRRAGGGPGFGGIPGLRPLLRSLQVLAPLSVPLGAWLRAQ